MGRLKLVLLAVALGALLVPASASAARTKSCDGIGKTVTKLQSRGPSCDTARTLSAKWAETAVVSGKRVIRIDGFRCVRSNPPGPGVAVRCAKRSGAVVVSFRFRRP